MSDIIVSGISKTYNTDGSPVPALSDISLNIAWGEFIGVSGESGSGKSTLLSILGAMLMPDSGVYTVDEIDIPGLSNEQKADFRREYLGFVFQSFHLMPYLTAIENIMLPLASKRIDSRTQLDLANRALDRVGLADKRKRLPDQLSGGEKERVAVARAIVNSPRILLADEPTGNLDSHNSGEVMSLFKELNSSGMTIIMVSHSAECIKSAGRTIRLSDGRILQQD